MVLVAMVFSEINKGDFILSIKLSIAQSVCYRLLHAAMHVYPNLYAKNLVLDMFQGCSIDPSKIITTRLRGQPLDGGAIELAPRQQEEAEPAALPTQVCFQLTNVRRRLEFENPLS